VEAIAAVTTSAAAAPAAGVSRGGSAKTVVSDE
jgi:hypothetical protein